MDTSRSSSARSSSARSGSAPSDSPRADSEDRIALARIGRQRWGAVAGQLASFGVAAGILGLQLPWAPLLALVAATAGSNIALIAWLRLERPALPRHIGAVLGLDVLLLTGLLYFTGGSSNPFGVLYLVHVTLAAVALGAGGSALIALLALGCYGILFFGGVPIPELEHAHHGDPRAFSLHLQGMWFAFAVAALLVGWFTAEMRTALRRRDDELELSRQRGARYERLAALGTLAAGAAHELGTPLGTIAVASREMERALVDPELREDARLIRDQVDRCQAILLRLRDQAGSTGGEALAPASLESIVAEAMAALAPARRERLRIALPSALADRRLPRGVVVRTLRDLLANAFDASPADGLVELQIRLVQHHEHEHELELAIIDRGTGMAAEVLSRAGDPFFTTKEPGRGMGLGLHLARTSAEQLGGTLELRSQQGEGTRAALRLPARAA